MGSRNKLVFASLISFMIALAFMVGLVPSHTTPEATAANESNQRPDMVDLLDAWLNLDAATPVTQINVARPRNNSLIRVPSDSESVDLSLTAIALGDAAPVIYGIDGIWGAPDWQGTVFSSQVSARPYRSTIDLRSMFTGTLDMAVAHQLYSFAVASVTANAGTATVQYELRSPGPADAPGTGQVMFELVEANVNVDGDKNGLPDTLFGSLGDGDTWLVSYTRAAYNADGGQSGTALRDTAVQDLGAEYIPSKAEFPFGVTVSPNANISVTSPSLAALQGAGAIDAGQTGVLIVSVVPDLSMLLDQVDGVSTPLALGTWGAAVSAIQPIGGLAPGAQFIEISIAATTATGDLYKEVETLPAGLSVELEITGLTIPADRDVSLWSYPTSIAKNGANYVLANKPSATPLAWSFIKLRDAAEAGQDADAFNASLTSLSVFGAFQSAMFITQVVPATGTVNVPVANAHIDGDFGQSVGMDLAQTQAAFAVYFSLNGVETEATITGGLTAENAINSIPISIPGLPVGSYTAKVVALGGAPNQALKADAYVVSDLFTLTTTTSGTGSGTVSANPTGSVFTAGTPVELTALPDAGSTFAGWTGDVTSSDNPVTVVMDGNKTVNAVFTKIQYTLTTSVLPLDTAGTVTPPSGSVFDSGAVVNLIATAAANYRFGFWSGDASGTDPSLFKQMDSDKNIVANFIELFTLTTNVSPVGAGTVAATPSAGPYDANSVVNLVATPNAGFIFDHWAGDTEGITPDVTASTIDVAMNGNKTLTAVFIPGFKLTAAVTPAGAGTIDASPPGSNGLNYPTGTQIVLTATANSGFQFLRWEGDASGTNAMTLITMDADKSVTAVFTPLYTLNIAITPTGAGSVTPPTGTTYPAGTSVTLIATDNAGFLFGQWSGDASGTSATVTIIMDSDKNVTAEFVQAFTLATDVSPAGAGSVTGNDLPKYADGTVVNLVAAPVGNYAFDHWEGDTGGITPDANSADIGVPMDRNRALTAVFVPTFVLTINVTPTDKGTVSRDPDLVRYVQNGTVHLVATPVEGYGFLRWEGDTDGILTASPDVNVVMDQDKTLTAVFAELVTLTKVVLPSDAAGTIAPAGSQFALGSTIQLVATAAEDYAFDFWTGDVSGTAPSISLLMDGNKSATAHFKFIGGVTLTTAVTPDGAGAVTVSPDGPTYPVGTTLILVASPAEGYAFSYWDGDVDGVQPDINTPIISLTINTDKSLTAVFVKTFTLTTNVNPTGTGSVTLNPPGGVYPEGTVVEVTATPNSGYGFNEWTGDSTDTQAVTQITMDANKSVTANFVRVFTLMTEVSPIGAGSVAANPPGGVYKNGTMVIVTATANPGFVFDSWTGDIAGVVDPTAASIGISMGADKSLTAVFAPLYTLTIEVVGNGSVQANPPGLTYKAGTVVNLTAIPGASSTFLRWELNAGGTSPTTSVTMNEPKLVRAIFQDTFTLTVDVVGGGNVTKVPDLVAYPAGSAVQLNATPQLGWVFAGWTGSVISDASAITVTMDSNKTITANFELGPPILILTTRVEPANGGTVTALPAGPYQVGQEVQLYATANSLFQFKNWIGNVVNPNSATTSIFMNGNRTVTAVFEQITPSIDSIGVFDSQGNLRGAHAWLFGGVKAKISGSGFKNGAAVIIDGQEVSPMAVTPTAIFFVVPPAVTPFQGTDGVLHVQVQVKNQPGLPLDFSAPAGFDYWRYVVDENGLVTTAFALDMTSKASTVVDIALGVNQLGFPNGGAELTLPMPVTPVNVNVAYGVALASKDPTDVHTDLINAGPNSQPVTNAWNFAIHLYNFNTEPIGSGLNTDVLYAEIKNWAYARTANTDSAKLKFPVDDTPLKISDIRNGLSMWSIDSSYDYKSLVETPDNPVVSIYQSTIMSNESDPNATAAVTTQVDSVVARLYDLSAFALRQGIQLPTDIKTGVEVDTVFGNGKGPVTGFTQVRIKAPNGGFAWVTIAFDDYDATNPAATNYALGTFTDKAGNPLPDGQRPGQNEYQMNVFTPPYKDQSVKTDVPVDIIIYLNGDLTTPAVVLSNGFIYQPVSKCDIGLILALLGLGAALIGLAAGGHDDNGGGGPCFIATAAYGTPMAAQIDTLRTFRDAYLLDSTVGTAFVDTYYRISPAVAEVVAKSPVLAAGVRIILIPMIFLAKIVMAKPLLTLTMLALAIIALRMRKRIRSRA